MLHPIVLALGSNLGDRLSNLNRAMRLLDTRGVRTLRRSRLYWTRPLAALRQPWYLNASILVSSPATPLGLLHLCQSVEIEMGRTRRERWSPRIIDIDLIYFGSFKVSHPELTLPHPAWADRDFVLRALIDLGVSPPVVSEDFRALSLARRLSEVERNIESSAPWP
jgi:2-amino-4-hydroxy-6-hydroxymethyldihydropteridine diphosphokinase